MTDDAKRVIFVAGVIVGLPLAIFLGYVAFVFATYLGLLVVILATLGAIALLGKLGAWVYWGWKGPRVIYESEARPARALVDSQGGITVLSHAPYPPHLQTLNFHEAIARPAISPVLPIAPVVDAAPPLPTAQPFSTIVREIAPGHLILGYNLAGKVVGDITDLLSTAIVGRPGTGKTTALRFCTAQVLRIGGQALLMDPHGSIADELSDVLECAEDGGDISRMAEKLEQMLDHRLALRRQGQRITEPLLLLADEWPVISRLCTRAIEIAGRIVLEGRKVQMFALISGQGLPSEQLGGSLVRDALSSRYVFLTTTMQARMAGLDSETAKALLGQLEVAGPGYAILASAKRKAEVIAIPQTTVADMRALLGDYPILAPLPMKPRFVGVQSKEPDLPAKAPVVPPPTLTHKASQVSPEQRAYCLAHREDMSASAIAVMLWNDAHKNVVVRQVWQEQDG